MTSKFSTIILMIIGINMIQTCSGSAIPMWEFLSRSEKMSHLYTTFAKLVSDYCRTSDARSQSVAQCKRDLLAYGLEQLQSFPDIHLDTLDPYQREANKLVWEGIMKDYPIVKTRLIQNNYESTSSSSYNDTKNDGSSSFLSSAPVSSSSHAIILQNTGFINDKYQQNPIFDNIDNNEKDGSLSTLSLPPSSSFSSLSTFSSSPSSSYAMDMDDTYGYNTNNEGIIDLHQQKPVQIYSNENVNNNSEPINHLDQSRILEKITLNDNNRNDKYSDKKNHRVIPVPDEIYHSFSGDGSNQEFYNEHQQQQTYLTGPMVVRVRPNGTPVEEDRNKPLPYDDDREIVEYGQIKWNKA